MIDMHAKHPEPHRVAPEHEGDPIDLRRSGLGRRLATRVATFSPRCPQAPPCFLLRELDQDLCFM